jgi:hypothetical protein
MTERSLDTDLSPEEQFLWFLARSWREPGAHAGTGKLNWARVIETGKANRMQALLHGVLSETGLLETLPPDIASAIREDAAQLAETAELLGHALRQYLHEAARADLETVVLKGLSVSVNIYGDAAVRPGGDIDLLVRKEDVDASLEILEGMGLGRWWPKLLDDAYYARHHLHQQRCTPDLKIWIEPHWALDHPYTLLTIDYESLMDRTTPGQLLGEPVQDLALSDLLLSLAVHLVKHAVYLPSTINRPDLPRIILADGMLLYYVDVAEVIKLHGAEIDWDSTVELAQQSGAVAILGSVLKVCHKYLLAPVPEWVLDALVVEPGGRLVQAALNRVANYEVLTYQGQKPSRMWDFLLMTHGAFILRPIRVLDTVAYFFPGTDYLRRYYGVASWKTAVRQLVRAAGQYGRLGIDTAFYIWVRHRRLRSLNQSISLYDRLEIDA